MAWRLYAHRWEVCETQVIKEFDSVRHEYHARLQPSRDSNSWKTARRSVGLKIDGGTDLVMEPWLNVTCHIPEALVILNCGDVLWIIT